MPQALFGATENAISAKPLVSPLRWLGGKRAIGDVVRDATVFFGANSATDPFLGSGSMAIGTGLQNLVVGDSNARLINFFSVCASNLEGMLEELEHWSDDKETFYHVRQLVSDNEVEEAARFFYLNRTGYGGVYRTNSDDRYNVPYGGGGRYDRTGLSEKLRPFGEAIGDWTLVTGDFRSTIEAGCGSDLLLLDPPYGHLGDRPFRRYGKEQFSFQDHVDLAGLAENAVANGSSVILTLPADEDLLRLYPRWARCYGRKRLGVLSEYCLLSERIPPVKVGGGWISIED